MIELTEAQMARMIRENNRADLGLMSESPKSRKIMGNKALIETIQLPDTDCMDPADSTHDVRSES